MSLTPSLNLPDAELPSVLSALQSEKQRRLTEDRLKYYAACFIGRSGSVGTGAIPKDAIGDLVTARGASLSVTFV